MNFTKALKLRSPNTGRWYLESTQYQSWKAATAGSASFTWLHGSAGAGKTILSAGIIHDLRQFCDADPARSLAIFFFDFQDAEKQKAINMIKSLLVQLLPKCARIPQEILSIYASCGNGQRQASEQQLSEALRHAVASLPECLLVLDALDECAGWEELFDVLEGIHNWGATNLRVLLTSRMETEIRDDLEDLVPSNSRICLETRLVDEDIKTYVHERLAKGKDFRRWQKDRKIQEEIEETLGRKAGGM